MPNPVPPFYAPQTTLLGFTTDVWKRFFLDVQNALGITNAPSDAQYLVATSDGTLSAERNLGLLATGYLKITTALGIATPSSVATIPATDLSGTLPGAVFPAVLPAVDGSLLTNLPSGASVLEIEVFT